MDPSDPKEPATVLDSTVRVPDNVVARELAGETVVLDTTSGQYHGLNATASAMFTALGSARTPREAAASVAGQLDAEDAVIERDLSELCLALARRGLIELG